MTLSSLKCILANERIWLANFACRCDLSCTTFKNSSRKIPI